MRQLLRQYRSFDRPSRLLMVNQFAINVGFYMLMPYLATYLAGPLGLAGWAVGLILGIRNFSQQGMFLLGGTLADRLGYKQLIVAGCLLRTAGFALLCFASSLPALLVASAVTGFAGALFNPAVRAYLAMDSGPRRLDAFAVFNVFYQAGILAGPIAGLALTAVDFRLTCGVAAAVFAVLSIAQIRELPTRTPVRPEDAGRRSSVLSDWRSVAANRTFRWFALVMIGSYVLSFQTYLALPLEAQRIAGSPTSEALLIAAMFGIAGGVAVAGQIRITAWCKRRWEPGTCVAAGMALMALSFTVPLLTARLDGPAAMAGLLLAACLLALGTVVVFPFEMDAIVGFAEERLVATYYGFYSTIVGAGILLGNLGTGSVVDVARAAGWPEAPWLGLALLGVVCAVAVRRLVRPRAPIGALVPVETR